MTNAEKQSLFQRLQESARIFREQARALEALLDQLDATVAVKITGNAGEHVEIIPPKRRNRV